MILLSQKSGWGTASSGVFQAKVVVDRVTESLLAAEKVYRSDQGRRFSPGDCFPWSFATRKEKWPTRPNQFGGPVLFISARLTLWKKMPDGWRD